MTKSADIIAVNDEGYIYLAFRVTYDGYPSTILEALLKSSIWSIETIQLHLDEKVLPLDLDKKEFGESDFSIGLDEEEETLTVFKNAKNENPFIELEELSFNIAENALNLHKTLIELSTMGFGKVDRVRDVASFYLPYE